MKKAYTLSFSGLSIGHHDFSFAIDKSLFVDYEEIVDAQVAVEGSLEKNERFLKLDMHLTGYIVSPCDRCLELMQLPIDKKECLIVNFGTENCFDDDIWILSEKEYQIDLENFFYESLVLERPFSLMHDPKDCSPDMLNNLRVTDENDDSDSSIDPRWGILSKLKNN